MHKSYRKYDRLVNEPAAIDRVRDALPAPTECRFCGGGVSLVNNAQFYGGREYGWPLAYACCQCGARVGCHPGTDIPLGTLADKATMRARRTAHDAFDPIWRDQGKGMRKKAYEALSKAMGKRNAHISWMDTAECCMVIELVQSGALKDLVPQRFLSLKLAI